MSEVCGFAVLAFFSRGFAVFADFSCGFAVSIVACGLRFLPKSGAVLRFWAILGRGFAVFIVRKHSKIYYHLRYKHLRYKTERDSLFSQ